MHINKELIRALITWTLTALAIGLLLALLIQALIQDAQAAGNEADRDRVIVPIGATQQVARNWDLAVAHDAPILNFAAGMATAYAIHETGHLVAGKLTHTDMHFKSFENGQFISFDMQPNSDSDGLWVATAGLNAQLLCSEAILRSRSLDRHDPFVRGMMTWNVINPVLYSLDYWFLRKWNQTGDGYDRGDIQCVEHYSNKRDADLFALSVSLLALYDGYRFLKPQNYNDKCRFYLSALPEGGVELGWRIEF